jgi:uncharacterized protein YfaP (DUF2135 family)
MKKTGFSGSLLLFVFTGLLVPATDGLFSQGSVAPRVRISKPANGFTRERVTTVSGVVENAERPYVTMVYNGISQRLRVTEGKFETRLVLSRGDGLIEVHAEGAKGRGKDTVAFFADVPKCDIKIVLTWDTPGSDMDLWVTDPGGEKVMYNMRTSKVDGQLDIDVTDGYGPETFTMQNAVAGDYQIQVQNYSPGEVRVTRMWVDLVLFEGTDNEQRRRYILVSWKQSEVVNVAAFRITPGFAFVEIDGR